MQCSVVVTTHEGHSNSTELVNLCLLDETLKAVGPVFLVPMSREIKYPTHGVNE